MWPIKGRNSYGYGSHLLTTQKIDFLNFGYSQIITSKQIGDRLIYSGSEIQHIPVDKRIIIYMIKGKTSCTNETQTGNLYSFDIIKYHLEISAEKYCEFWYYFSITYRLLFFSPIGTKASALTIFSKIFLTLESFRPNKSQASLFDMLPFRLI